ncbi:MAG: prepilin peptidase [Coriobacteriia bacterium]|nr:prepilin peptidase [Coriobacteriia bacterium]
MTAYMPLWFFAMSMGLFGLLFGSFANVVIWRVPRGESIVSPGSHCPRCETAIAWYDNIPVVSWMVLRARCRTCGESIAVRYPLVEAAAGVLFVAAALRFGVSGAAIVAAVLFWFLLVLSVIDLDTMRLPNVLVGALAGVGAAAAIAGQISGLHLAPLVGTAASGWLSEPVPAALLGAAIGVALPGGLAALYGLVRHKRGLGMGDVKLLAVLGIFVGPYVVMCMFIGSLLGLVAGLAAARGRSAADTRIPFGPWLAAGCVLTVLAGPALWVWYLGIVGLA